LRESYALPQSIHIFCGYAAAFCIATKEGGIAAGVCWADGSEK
jgi:hypothetical protein